ncbi:hypothetical protein GCM10023200_50280 [Actinomycetospora chlora]|uniref:Uncharacterized protein n=1 Tax=Actinomycetospora chlora TaxID=663608 RepID=A0ABP9CBX5_9PSEU
MSPANPEEKSEKAAGVGLTFPQIIASALAAATAAILGSFLGVIGTIGGAAVASIITTVGSALYQKSLEVTRDRVKQRLVVAGSGSTKVAAAVGRVTGHTAQHGVAQGVPQGARAPGAPRPGMPAPGARLGAPAPGVPVTRAQPTRVVGPPTPGPGVPGPQARPGTPPADPTRRMPGAAGPGRPVAPGRVALRADGLADPTQVHPRQAPGPQDTGARPTAFIPQSRQTGTPPGGGPTQVMGPGGPPPGTPVTQVAPLEPEPSGRRFSLAAISAGLRSLGWKTWVTLGGVAASVFVIAIIASVGVETAAGHPLSGGQSGTSVGSIFGQETGTGEATTTPADSATEDSSTETSSNDTQQQQDQQQGGGDTGSQAPTTTTSRSTQSSQNPLPNLLPRSGSGGGATNG